MIHFYLHIINVSFQCNYRVSTFTKLRAVPWLCSSIWFHYYWGEPKWFLPLQTSSANSWICFSVVSESDTFAMSNKVIKLYIKVIDELMKWSFLFYFYRIALYISTSYLYTRKKEVKSIKRGLRSTAKENVLLKIANNRAAKPILDTFQLRRRKSGKNKRKNKAPYN